MRLSNYSIFGHFVGLSSSSTFMKEIFISTLHSNFISSVGFLLATSRPGDAFIVEDDSAAAKIMHISSMFINTLN